MASADPSTELDRLIAEMETTNRQYEVESEWYPPGMVAPILAALRVAVDRLESQCCRKVCACQDNEDAILAALRGEGR
jgi:hypothetical protein